MAKTISVSIPHRLTPAEVRARLESALADARRQYPQYTGALQETWSGNTMNLRMSAMGQTITGRVEVLPEAVQVHVDLPIFLAMLADTIRPRIEAEIRKRLSGPKA